MSPAKINKDTTLAPRTPGFTAESSLGRASNSYSAPLRAGRYAGAEVVPQFSLLRWPKPGGCDMSCACITEEGCPCCTSIPRTRRP
jgi:hypothetical protein